MPLGAVFNIQFCGTIIDETLCCQENTHLFDLHEFDCPRTCKVSEVIAKDENINGETYHQRSKYCSPEYRD